MNNDAIIIYDGECGICSALAEWILLKDKKNLFRIIPFQNFDFSQFDNNLTINEAMKSVIMIDIRTAKYYKGSRAVFEIAKNLGGIYKIIGFFGANRIISSIFNPFYYLIARNRRKISVFLGFSACSINYDKSTA